MREVQRTLTVKNGDICHVATGTKTTADFQVRKVIRMSGNKLRVLAVFGTYDRPQRKGYTQFVRVRNAPDGWAHVEDAPAALKQAGIWSKFLESTQVIIEEKRGGLDFCKRGFYRLFGSCNVRDGLWLAIALAE